MPEQWKKRGEDSGGGTRTNISGAPICIRYAAQLGQIGNLMLSSQSAALTVGSWEAQSKHFLSLAHKRVKPKLCEIGLLSEIGPRSHPFVLMRAVDRTSGMRVLQYMKPRLRVGLFQPSLAVPLIAGCGFPSGSR